MILSSFVWKGHYFGPSFANLFILLIILLIMSFICLILRRGIVVLEICESDEESLLLEFRF
jgi:hypothetical protein